MLSVFLIYPLFSVLFQQETPDSPGEVFLDPNTLSEDGTVSVGAKSFSHDGKILAYSVSVSGSDWRTIKVRDRFFVSQLPIT